MVVVIGLFFLKSFLVYTMHTFHRLYKRYFSYLKSILQCIVKCIHINLLATFNCCQIGQDLFRSIKPNDINRASFFFHLNNGINGNGCWFL